jgi:heme-degrading monooxygenase HmoA
MVDENPSSNGQHVYRIDKLVVPAAARREFLERAAESKSLLQRQSGFVRSQVFEQCSGPGEFNFVTVVEWESAEALERAAAALARRQAELGYDRAKTAARLGIRSDMANYRQLAEDYIDNSDRRD